jgi:SAM-dependent methyltransferase
MADPAIGHADQVRKLFDAKAATWSAKYAPNGRLADRLARLADAVGYHASVGSRVLDLGCGTGELARHMAAAGLRVTGCDISAEMLGHAAAGQAGAAVEWVHLAPAWRTLPFEATTFDAIVASSVLEYLDSPGAVVNECARVLRSGGVMLCTVPNPTHPIRWVEWVVALGARVTVLHSSGWGWPRLDQHLTYLTTSRQRHSTGWWCALAARAGLATVRPSTYPPEHSPLSLLTFQRPVDNLEAGR